MMTRDEIIKEYEAAVAAHAAVAAVGIKGAEKSYELFKAGLSALRPVVREQVEKVWPGCPYCKEDGEGYVQKFGAYSIQNGQLTTGHCKPQKIKFCPHCSRPLTDEAVQMVMERMEALHDTGN